MTHKHGLLRRFAAIYIATMSVVSVLSLSPAFAVDSAAPVESATSVEEPAVPASPDTGEAEETKAQPTAGIVSASALHLRSQPSTGSASLGLVKKGSPVTILETTGSWYKVRWNSLEGYMYSEYVDISSGDSSAVSVGIITGSVVNMRSEPSTSSKVLKKLMRNTKVNVSGVSGGWYKIEYDGVNGYIHPDYLEIRTGDLASRGVSADSSDLGERIVATAKKYLGVRYKYGGASPSGFDCSGFTYYIFKSFGYNLNRGATGQLKNGVKISKSELRPGDLVFFNQSGSSSSASHVGIYVGGGNFIHASSPGDVVKITTLTSGYYLTYYIGARRII